MSRPTGVLLITIWECIGVFFTAVFGAIMLAGGGFIATMLGPEQRALATMIGTVGVAAGIFCLILAAVWGFVTYGFWNLKNWARVVVLVFAILGACMNGLGLLNNLLHMRIGLVLWSAIWTGLNVWIAIYLTQPEAKTAFQA